MIAGAPLMRLAFAAEPKPTSLRGTLIQNPAGLPAIDTANEGIVVVHGDDATLGVVKDERLAGSDFEAVGHRTGPLQFEIDGIYERAMFVHKGGKRLMITYWCDVCYIRTYTPGPCVCCQKYTDLDLRESVDEG